MLITFHGSTMKCTQLFVFIWLLVIICKCKSEIFAALSDIQGLVKTQEHVIESLEEYVKTQEKGIEIVKEYLNAMKIEHKLASTYPNYLQNPFNAFTLIKRLSHDLELVESIIKSGTDYKKNLVVNYPSHDDLFGASEGLHRILATYLVNITELSSGVLRSRSNADREEKIINFKLSYDDCYFIGQLFFDSEQYKPALQWFWDASDLFVASRKTANAPYKLVDILKSVVESSIKLNECIAASDILTSAVTAKLDPADVGDVKQMIEDCEQVIVEDEEEVVIEKENTNTVKNNEMSTETTKDTTYLDPSESFMRYERFCRGEMDINPAVKHRLKCRYLRRNPFLFIAPFKMEELYLDPDMYLIDDVISDREIRMVQEVSRGQMERAQVVRGNHSEPSKVRVSKTVWLDGIDCSVLDKLFDRVRDITGYDLTHSDLFQIANYGIGGHYNVHSDVLNSTIDDPGKRIATIMIYLTDVEQGGATTFTKFGVTMFPKKGAAVFWRNLYHNGEKDNRMVHGACPVLLGDKWGINLWIYEHGQEFIEPCSLDPNHGMTSELLPPVAWNENFGLVDEVIK